MGTRCRCGRRPGGSVLARKGQGSQAYLSLPPSCDGVSYSKARQLGPHTELGIPWGRTGWIGNRREPRKVPPHLSYRKAPSVTRCARRLWEPGAGGRRPGGSGSAWMNQGLRTDLRLAAALCRRPRPVVSNLEWLIRMSRSREAETRWFESVRARRVTWPGLKRSRSDPVRPTRPTMSAQAARRQLVWGPGAGAEAAGRLCPCQKRTGVASIP